MSDTFPPLGPTGLTKVIPSYLYDEYTDDDTCQDFVDAFNQQAQNYITFFNDLNLPVYTGGLVSGSLLDWVGEGVYGIARPTLPIGNSRLIGPLNTYMLNTLQLNAKKVIPQTMFYVTTDDVYRRIITWAFYKGDGKVFSVEWLKKRVWRFLIGTNGTAPNIDQTYRVSVRFSEPNGVDIVLSQGGRMFTKTALPNTFELNTRMPNQATSTFTPSSPIPFANIFKTAVEVGALELPFQFAFTVTII